MKAQAVISSQYLFSLVVFTIVLVSLTQVVSAVDPTLTLFDFGHDNPYRSFNKWINSFLFSESFILSIENYANNEDVSYYLVSYLRDLVAGTCVYWLTASTSHFVIYHVLGKKLFTDKGRPFPKWDTFKDQMTLAQAAIFVYAGLPVFSEFLIESGYTKCYFYISDIGGWRNYFLGLFAYIVCFEVGIYWMHRTLHTNKFLYKYVHGLHHKYNKAETMTPWASIAFNPLDGLLQASPYVFFLTLVPVHYFTHIFLLFFSGVWATLIHDSVPAETEPIMGAAYHTIHHTHYHYNFGQWFIFCDYIFGTLRSRKDLEAINSSKKIK